MRNISGTYIKKLRQSKGYSLREFAKMIYSSKSSLQRWEKSTLPDDEDLIERIASALDTTVDELYEKSRGEKNLNLTDKQLTEIQFGVKGLAFILSFLSLFVIIFILSF